VEDKRRGHYVQRNSETLFLKITQTCGCSPSPVTPFIHRGSQASTGLESFAHESTNWSNWIDTKASS